jgi:hypothetical protein
MAAFIRNEDQPIIPTEALDATGENVENAGETGEELTQEDTTIVPATAEASDEPAISDPAAE